MMSRVLIILAAVVLTAGVAFGAVTLLLGDGGYRTSDRDEESGRSQRPADDRDKPTRPERLTAAQRACLPGEKLTWEPPELKAPETLKLPVKGGRFDLDSKKDYIIDLGDRPIRGGTRLTGGRNIVIIGGEINAREGKNGETSAGLSLWDQADGGTIHIEGVRFGGALHDAMTFQQPDDTTVQIQNVRVDNLQNVDEVNWTVHHPDMVQTWTGPSVLRIDRLTGYSPYQGLFFKPEDRNYKGRGGGHVPDLTDLRNINLRVRSDRRAPASRMLWQESEFPLKITNLWIDAGLQKLVAYPSNEAWKGIRFGVPQTGDFVGDEVGLNYRSPGYGDVRQPSGEECQVSSR